MLAVTMTMSTFSLFALAVLSSDLEAEFGLSKFELGMIGAVNTGVGGLTAPLGGRVADKMGARFAMGAVIIGAGITNALAAVSPSYIFLLVVMAIAGVPQGLGNPATNKAIATGVVAEKRGLLTGLKQSGVQLGAFTSGFFLPPIAEAWSWRAGMWCLAGMALIALVGLRAITVLEGDETAAARDSTVTSTSDIRQRMSPFVYQVATYGFLLGIVGGGIGRFLPLFAEEGVGLSVQTAGIIFGLSGLVAIPSRIAWGIALDRGFSPRRAMIILGIGAALSSSLLLFAIEGRSAVLWIATILSGLTIGSWNTAANLAMIRQNDGRGAGQASGILLFGFLLGLTVGSPVVGWSIDVFDSYRPAWAVCSIACAIGVAVVARRPRSATRYS
jgi:sugar phosphate permease